MNTYLEKILADLRASVLRAKEKINDLESQKVLDQLFEEIRDLEKTYLPLIENQRENTGLSRPQSMPVYSSHEIDLSSLDKNPTDSRAP